MSLSVGHNRRDLLVPYFLLAFAFTWGIAALVLFAPGPLEAAFGHMSSSNPVFVVAVAGPTVAATILTFVRGGWAGLGTLYRQLLRWRFGLQWYVALVVGLPLICCVTSLVTRSRPSDALSTPALLLGLLLHQLILGPLGEELGWRGFALPRLLQRLTPFAASLVLGMIWGVWHLPAFFVSGLPQAGISVPVFLFGALCMSILATWIFHHTSGSVLSVVLFHYIANVSTSLFGTPFAAFAVAMGLAAALVLILDRRLGWFRRVTVLANQTSPAFEAVASGTQMQV
jgi:membrane protease YdiL (CAAX protease family)